MNGSLTAFTQRTLDIEEDLDEVDVTLNQLSLFDGSVNMTDIMDLERQLLRLNTTVASLSLAANQSLAQLLRDQARIHTAWAELERLDSEAGRILANLTEGEAMVPNIKGLVEDANVTYQMLRRNLTDLDVRADRLARQLDVLAGRDRNLSEGIDAVNMSLASFSVEVGERRVEIENLLALARNLTDSVLSLEQAAEEAETSASNLVVRNY